MKIDIQKLRHTYPSGDEALKGIDLTIEGTEPVAIIGQNGSGKTTLVKHFNGILRPTEGDVVIDGQSISCNSTAQWARKVGYVFQNPDDQLFLETVKKELEFGARQIGMNQEKIASQLEIVSELCDLKDKLDKHPFDLRGTEKKFCTIGSIMMMDPEVLVFDEPTCGQDNKGTERLRNIIRFLRKQGKLCITISHDMKFVVGNFSRAIVLCNGEVLLDGSMEHVFSMPEVLAKSFVYPPPVTRVAGKAGLENTVLNIEGFIKSFEKTKSEKGVKQWQK